MIEMLCGYTENKQIAFQIEHRNQQLELREYQSGKLFHFNLEILEVPDSEIDTYLENRYGAIVMCNDTFEAIKQTM